MQLIPIGSPQHLKKTGSLLLPVNVGVTLGPAALVPSLASFTVGSLLYPDTTTTLTQLLAVAVNNALISGGLATAPSWGKIGLTTHVSGILPVANGGTNISSYAIGDLLYASAAGVLSPLADVAVGQVLASGGVGAAPTWSASPALTTSLTVPLIKAPAAALAIRPTTDGITAIQLQDKDGNSILNVDTTNDRVGIGTASPQVLFHVNGKSAFGDSVTTARSTRALNLISTDAVMHIERLSDASSPAVELYHDNAAGTNLTQWDFFAYGAGGFNNFSIRNRAPVDNVYGLTLSYNGGVAIGTYAGFTATPLPPANGMIIPGNVGIGTTAPTNLLSLGGNAARIFWIERHTTANTAGNSLTVQAGGATAAATDKAGGQLILLPGLSTGSAESGITIRGCVAGGAGTGDNSLQDMIKVLGNKLGVFNTTPAVQQNHIADASGGVVIDAEARVAINAALLALETYGLLKAA